MTHALDDLLARIRACRLCEGTLPHGPRPVVQAGAGARILVIGQAPGAKVHASGVPWDDASGARLRDWLGMPPGLFYDPGTVAIMPMGFCYPGKAASGDLPPRRECAATWHAPLLGALPGIGLALLVGSHAVNHYLRGWRRPTLAGSVRDWAAAPAPFWPLPHPSPRNVRWFLDNPWFESDLLPALKARIRAILLAEGGTPGDEGGCAGDRRWTIPAAPRRGRQPRDDTPAHDRKQRG